MTNDAVGGTEGLASALGDVTDRTRDLVRAEVDAARRELKQRMLADMPGLLYAGAASGAAVFAAASAYRFSLQLFERLLPRPYAAAAATACYGGMAAAASRAALKRLRRAPMPFPQETAEATRAGFSAAGPS